MIEIQGKEEDMSILVSGKEVDILDAGENYILAECELSDLINEPAQPLKDGLQLEIHSENGFGTYFFHELRLSQHQDGVCISFICHTPNKFWEGQYGLATFLTAVNEQAIHQDNWTVADLELEDDWKGITLERVVANGNSLHASILAAADDLVHLLHNAEVALSGLRWKDEFFSDEKVFCQELLYPLLRRMGFLFVRYSHGTKEYGKDFTFSEATPFGDHRHYGLQAKAGNVSGGVNADIDELLGQINDAFAMPYYELGSKEQRYISTYIIAISGTFTANAREKIIQKMPQGCIGSVYFLDKERITELVERYWRSSKI